MSTARIKALSIFLLDCLNKTTKDVPEAALALALAFVAAGRVIPLTDTALVEVFYKALKMVPLPLVIIDLPVKDSN